MHVVSFCLDRPLTVPAQNLELFTLTSTRTAPGAKTQTSMCNANVALRSLSANCKIVVFVEEPMD